MAKAKQKKPNAYLYAFMAIAVLALAAILYVALGASSADESTQQATVNNSAPTVTSVAVATSSGGGHVDPISPIEGDTRTIYIRGEVADANGCTEVNNANNYEIAFFRTGMTSAACDDPSEADGNFCYIPAPSDITLTNCGGSDTTVDYEATVDLEYFADSTGAADTTYPSDSWTVAILVSDGTASGTNTTTTNIASALGVDVTASVDYSALGLGDYSAEKTIEVTQQGNVESDLNVSGTDFTCTVGGSQVATFSAGQLKYSDTNISQEGAWSDSEDAWGGSTAVTSTPTALDFNLEVQTVDGTPKIKNLYTYLQIPSEGAAGTCSADMTITAKTDVD